MSEKNPFLKVPKTARTPPEKVPIIRRKSPCIQEPDEEEQIVDTVGIEIDSEIEEKNKKEAGEWQTPKNKSQKRKVLDITPDKEQPKKQQKK